MATILAINETGRTNCRLLRLDPNWLSSVHGGNEETALAAMEARLDADPAVTAYARFDEGEIPDLTGFSPGVLVMTPGSPATLSVDMDMAREAYRQRGGAAPSGRKKAHMANAAIDAAPDLATLNALWDPTLDDPAAAENAGYGALGEVKSTLAGSGAPGVNDDAADGWSVGSVWFDPTTKIQYTCADATGGAAVWHVTGSPGLYAIGNLVPTAGKFPVWTGSASASAATVSSAGLALLDDANAAAQRATLGLAPVSNIADPSGGSTIDAEARTAITSILSALEALGLLSSA